MSDNFSWPEGEKLVFIRPPHEFYNGNLSNYYHPDCFPELQVLKNNWEAIRDEIFEFEKLKGSISQMDSLSPAITEGNSWNAIILKNYNWRFIKNIKDFPFTSSIIESIPNCTLTAISKLGAHTSIKPHHGETNGTIRVHLGLHIPGEYPDLGLKVGGEDNCWENGKLICYPDIKKHEAWNHSPHDRYILIMDIVTQPLKSRINYICSMALANQSFIYFYQRFKLVALLPVFLQNAIIYKFSIIWKVYLKIQGIFYKNKLA